mgnify:FL=1
MTSGRDRIKTEGYTAAPSPSPTRLPMNTALRLAALLALLLLTRLTPALAAEGWVSAATLPGLQPLTVARHAAQAKQLEGTPIRYLVAAGPEGGQLHAADLVDAGSLDLDVMLVVTGNLHIAGDFDDGRGSGHLIVLGDMAVDNVLSWGALQVGGDLNARGVVFAYYNDFSFGVQGKVNAAGLVVHDKFNGYTAGKLGFDLGDGNGGEGHDAEAGKALRLLQPALFTDPEVLELDEYSSLGSLGLDYDITHQWVLARRPLLRAQPAPLELVAQAEAAIAADTPVEDLRALIGKDVLLAQLIAARLDVPAALHADLLAVDDPIVQRWMAQVAPAASFAQRRTSLTPEVAATLAAHPDTDAAALATIAADSDPAVRLTLAERDTLPLDLREKLANDADARVRAAVLDNTLGEATRAKRVADEALEVRRVVASLSLDAEQTRRLLAESDGELRQALARSLQAQAEFRAPARMDEADRSAIAAELLDSAASLAGEDYHRRQFATAAFLALSPDAQAARFDAALRQLDLDVVVEFTPSVAVMQRLVALAAEYDAPIPEDLGSNLRLPDALQEAIVDAAAAFDPSESDQDSYDPTPDDALENLLYNDAAAEILSDARFLQITQLILDRGIRPADGSVQNAYFHYDHFSAEAIDAIGRRLRGNEDWALTVLMAPAATREQLVPALARWYDDEEVVAELQAMADLDDGAFWTALANAKSYNLREAAARSRHAPVELLARLVDDPEQDVRMVACWNRRLPAELAVQLATRGKTCAFGNPALPLATLETIANEAPSNELRRTAREALSLRRRIGN